jgi:8-oxo-dGTP pyrophosphatase MutT (NUDIX family)
VTARPSATVVLLRPTGAGTDAGFETFMARRDSRSRFAADMSVFPGGAVQADDADPELVRRCPGLSPDVAYARLVERGSDPPPTPDAAFALHIAALRELFEEAGVLLGDRGDSGDSSPSRRVLDRLAEARAGLQGGTLSLVELVAREQVRLAPECLVYVAHWITPRVLPRRFDTRFFVAAVPPDQQAVHCGVETTAGAWYAPVEALEQCAAGAIKLMQPTEAVLRALAPFASVDEALAWARAKPIRTVNPSRVADRWVLNVEGDRW